MPSETSHLAYKPNYTAACMLHHMSKAMKRTTNKAKTVYNTNLLNRCLNLTSPLQLCKKDSGLSCYAALSQYHTRGVQALLTLSVILHALSNLHNLWLPCNCNIAYTGIWDTCVGIPFFCFAKRMPEIVIPRSAAPAFLCSTGNKPRTVTVRGSVHVCGGLCSRPQTGEMFCLHVCQQPTLRWESSQSLVHNLGSCFWLGLQIDLHKRPSPVLGTPLFFSAIACRDQDHCE